MATLTPIMTTNPQQTPSLFPGKAWQQVLARDAAADGQFVYAVRSTKIFCRPSCPSRRPLRKNVTFFSTPAAAVEAGYRACERCEPEHAAPKADPHAAAIAAVARYLDENYDGTATLTELGQIAGLNPFNLQRSFTRILGVSPREYANARKLERFKTEVRKDGRITDAVYDAGYSSSSRVYERSSQSLGMKPTELRSGGKGQHIRYAISDSPIGKLLVAATEKGVCSIALADTAEELETELRKQFANAELEQDNAHMKVKLNAVLGQLGEHPASVKLPMDVRATAFQLRVWQALQQIPRGETRTYADVARELGQPTAVRAVARAIATNPLAVIVPCHRVIGSNGTLTGYRWGLERKRALLAAEGDR